MASSQHVLLKISNIRSVFEIIRKNVKISRYELSEQTKLSLTSMTRIITKLESMGFVRESEVVSDRPGRKTKLIEVVPDSRLTAGIHIEKDFIRVGLINVVNEIVASVERKCTGKNFSAKETMDWIAGVLNELIKKTGIDPTSVVGTGIALPGVVDYEQGILHFSPQLMWQELPIKNIAQDVFPGLILVDNDINLFALGENTNGIEGRPKSVAVLSIGSGVGASFVNENGIFRGAFNMTGEIGHARVDVGGIMCECGRVGCLQTHMAQRAIINKAREIDPSIKTVNEIMAYMEEGVFWAVSIINDVVNYAAIAIGMLASLFDPETVIIGGELIEQYGSIFERIVKRYNDTEYAMLRSRCKIIESGLKDHAVWYGAAVASMSEYSSGYQFNCFDDEQL